MMARRSISGAVGQAAISSSVRPQPVQMPRATLQMLRHGEGTELAATVGMAQGSRKLVRSTPVAPVFVSKADTVTT